MSTIVSRDPFARAGLRRETVNTWGSRCDWCGEKRQRLYTYVIESDTGRQPILGQPVGSGKGKAFCNLDCFRSYSS